MSALTVRPLTKETFAPFGDVLDVSDPAVERRMINGDTTTRFHRLTTPSAEAGDVIVSVFRGEPRIFPFEIAMMERHPLGSQTFYPLSDRPWMAVVAADENGVPGVPHAFLATGAQGVTYATNVWHHPLIAVKDVSDFLVIDRDGKGGNLEEAFYPAPHILQSSEIG